MGIFPLSLICHKSGISALLLQARSWAVAVAAKIRESKNQHRGHSRLRAFTPSLIELTNAQSRRSCVLPLSGQEYSTPPEQTE